MELFLLFYCSGVLFLLFYCSGVFSKKPLAVTLHGSDSGHSLDLDPDYSHYVMSPDWDRSSPCESHKHSSSPDEPSGLVWCITSYSSHSTTAQRPYLPVKINFRHFL